MASKRKAKSSSQRKNKKAKRDVTTDTERTDLKKAIELLMESDVKKKRSIDVDSACPCASTAKVVAQYDCTLSKANIATNSNEYLKMQLLKNQGKYYTWKRGGRVGYSSKITLKECKNLNEARSEFKNTFKSMTNNDWSDKNKFKIGPEKFVVVETTGYNTDKGLAFTNTNKVETLKCTLDYPTQCLIQTIFDKKMFKTTLKEMDINVEKMPLGQLSKHQIAKGFEVLEEIKAVLDNGKSGDLTDLSSRFYSFIPHYSGTRRPAVISSMKQLRSKIDMLKTLGDIEVAQEMQNTEPTPKAKTIPHPLDVQYEKLKCDMQLLLQSSAEYQMVRKYFFATSPLGNPEILNIWALNRHSEADRYKSCDEIENRKLLWHGTKIHAVAAILKEGLVPSKIMGFLGRAIYFASESRCSAGYVGTNSKKIGFMFLAEVALGKQHVTTGFYHTTLPKEFDSLWGKGYTEPDPEKDVKIKFDGMKVIVPLGQPIQQLTKTAGVPFFYSEYAIHDERHCRLRYLVEVKFNHKLYY